MLDILLVEDDELIADFEQYLLKGYNVTVVCTGKEAIEHAKKHNIDLLMQNVLLPDANGCQVALQISNTQNNLVVAFVTEKTELISEKELLALKSHKNVFCSLFLKNNDGIDMACKFQKILQLVEISKFFDIRTKKYNPLSNQEARVLKYVSKKMKSKEIARKLNISPRSVEEYKRRANEKIKAIYFLALSHPLILEILEEIEPVLENGFLS